MKKIIILLVLAATAISMVFAGTGCQPAAVTTTESAASTTASAVETTATVASETTAAVTSETTAEAIGPISEITKDPISINVWVISGTGVVEWIKFAEDKLKEKYPNVEFNTTLQSGEFMMANGVTTLGSNPKDIDLANWWSGTWLQELLKNKSVLNIDSWYEHYGWDDMFVPGAYSTNFVEGFGHAAFNYNWYSFTVFYNKKIFEQVGVNPPKTMDEYWGICEKIKNAGFEVFTVGGKEGWPYTLAFASMLGRYQSTEEANKFNFFSLNPNKTAEDAEAFRTDAVKKTWQYLADMNSKGYFSPGVNSLDYMDANDHFASGKAAMMWGFVPFSFNDAKAQDPNLPVGTFIMPDTDKSDGGVVISYNDLFTIPAGVEEVKKPILAELFNIMLTDKDTLKKAVELGLMPATTNITPAEVAEVSNNEDLGKALEDLKNRPVLGSTDVVLSMDLVNEYYKLCQEVTEGITTPDQACQRMYDLALQEIK